MKHAFPIIKHIDDVLPAIDGRDEFVVADRPGFNVVNYNVAFQDTFIMNHDEVMENHGNVIPVAVMRRECRGLIFDSTDGRIISRPFHKFFNMFENDEMQPCNMDLGANHVVFDKMDGSMVRPLVMNGEVFLATKMGITDVAKEAMKFVTAEQSEWLKDQFESGMTPLIEYVGPDNRIVVRYDESDLVLLALAQQ